MQLSTTRCTPDLLRRADLSIHFMVCGSSGRACFLYACMCAVQRMLPARQRPHSPLQLGAIRGAQSESTRGNSALQNQLKEVTAEKQRLAAKLSSLEDDRSMLQQQLQEVRAPQSRFQPVDHVEFTAELTHCVCRRCGVAQQHRRSRRTSKRTKSACCASRRRRAADWRRRAGSSMQRRRTEMRSSSRRPRPSASLRWCRKSAQCYRCAEP